RKRPRSSALSRTLRKHQRNSARSRIRRNLPNMRKLPNRVRSPPSREPKRRKQPKLVSSDRSTTDSFFLAAFAPRNRPQSVQPGPRARSREEKWMSVRPTRYVVALAAVLTVVIVQSFGAAAPTTQFSLPARGQGPTIPSDAP